MKNEVIVRIPNRIYRSILKDLARPHPFAFERVGFAFTKHKKFKDGSILVLVTDYKPVDDSHYIDDNTVGAKINAEAIRQFMQLAYDTKLGMYHVHMHEHDGMPHLSYTDKKDLPNIVRSFQNLGLNQTNGILLLSNDSINSFIWSQDDKDPKNANQVSVVGYPMRFNFPFENLAHKNDENNRYNRQSFLGENSQFLIERVKVGIIGLGGGGSHVVQQLAHIGIQNYIQFDDDFVDFSNLNRLIGATLEDAKNKTLKIDVSERVIRALQPDAKIISKPDKWQNHAELLQQCDIVFGCVDTAAGRRDLENECRRYLIPYIDIGMDVFAQEGREPRMVGQVVLSMPGELCFKCLGLITEEDLAREAANYGAVGGRPQVVWPNGILASTAIGIFMDLITNWTKEKEKIIYLSYDGNKNRVLEDNRLQYNINKECNHFPLNNIGPISWNKL